MISRTLARPAEDTVPPLPVVLKKSASLNSQASVVCATNTMSRALYSRRSPAATEQKKHRCTQRRLPAAGELPKTQIFVGECRRIRLKGAPLHGFLERAAAVET